MAFPLPAHLPRQLDVSSQILGKLDEANGRTLTSSLASSWRTELDESIRLTKKRIHDRIESDSEAFQRQLTSARSVQSRLRTVASTSESVSSAISDPNSCLGPPLLSALSAHQSLTQASLNADILHDSLVHLADCRQQLQEVDEQLRRGNLSEAVTSCQVLSTFLETAPSPLREASVLASLKREHSVRVNRIEELLSNTYARCIEITPSEISIRPLVFIPNSDASLEIPTLLQSLSQISLETHLSTLRRDLTTHYFDYLSEQPSSVTVSEDKDASGLLVYKLERFHLPPAQDSPSSRLDNLAAVMEFVKARIFAHLPGPQAEAFPRSLSRPLTNATLNRLVVPALPSTLDALPAFLRFTQKAVEFESKYITDLLTGQSSTGEEEVKSWVDGVSGHYERARRLSILGASRRDVLESQKNKETFYAELITIQEATVMVDSPPPIEIVQSEDNAEGGWGLDEAEAEEDPPSLFQTPISPKSPLGDDGWGFDDEEAPTSPVRPTKHEAPKAENKEHGWGWHDDAPMDEPPEANGHEPHEVADEDLTWDDPWGDDATEEPSPESRPPPAPSIPTSQPKVAAGIAKARSKHKQKPEKATPANENGNGNGVHNHSPTQPPSKAAQAPPPVPEIRLPQHVKTREERKEVKEQYLVSAFTKSLVKQVEDALKEGRTLSLSGVFAPSARTSTPGSLIMQSASLILDLYRALYPVVNSEWKISIRYSNDCFYLSEQVKRLAKQDFGSLLSNNVLEESSDNLRSFADSLFYNCIEAEQDAVREVLGEAEGFTESGDQERYDDYETTIAQVQQMIRRLPNKWKPVLPRSKYYEAIGAVVEAALGKMLEGITALPDIPEVESHKLSELCRILNSLEGLFVEDMEQPSFVVSYVPSWLKFSYLSELLEASMADVTYLFEQGALVDFEIDELVRLVEALFAATPLRATTIEKIRRGHPNFS
ncbi:hypothetical protein CONPUDRAFT_59149 [Coniophora puteana RWD-64-598 SS2]|uniref:ZW10 C-terminal helical domain-containing protein n=1 Tax=Coniophora puteana (strain RWD-64-598) TaxID=741705 RepID=A0A5M3MLF7_CONPW|nr:uncharacterized protein CONPUDRAFT_59149 [Coniophora puteana RWD-64-598 SS2]EIW79411.1 hypothetical protein CONPUDRAFT_59149 [Coniophora puteana RWD-64-598 SS2]